MKFISYVETETVLPQELFQGLLRQRFKFRYQILMFGSSSPVAYYSVQMALGFQISAIHFPGKEAGQRSRSNAGSGVSQLCKGAFINEDPALFHGPDPVFSHLGGRSGPPEHAGALSHIRCLFKACGSGSGTEGRYGHARSFYLFRESFREAHDEGLGSYRRLREGGRIVPLWSGLTTAFLGFCMYMSAKPLIRLFTGDEQTIAYALVCIGLQIPFQWCYCVLNTILNLANGVGAVKFSTLVNLLMLWAVRIPAAFLISRFYDGHYVTFGVSISFMFGLAASLTFYRSKRWKEIVSKSGEGESGVFVKRKEGRNAARNTALRQAL